MTEPATSRDFDVQSSPSQLPRPASAFGAPQPAESLEAAHDLEGDYAKARGACQSLERQGRNAGWALAGIGVLIGIVAVLGRTSQNSAPASWPPALLAGGLWAGAGALGGWCLTAVSRAAAALAIAHLVQAKHNAQIARVHAAQAMQLLERIARLVEERRTSMPESAAELEKAKKRAAIEHATRTASWEDAESLLSAYEAEHPFDPEVPALRAAFLAGRRGAVDERLSEIEAARRASDPGRVLDLHDALVPMLDHESRVKLHGDLAPWFLGVIHRRLRVGKIQPDVVRLAERFTEAFSTTVEGASVRASLSTLRRSVGLCPRCSQPYVGVADACPTCLGRASVASEATGAELATPS
jgi:hypothetical protein